MMARKRHDDFRHLRDNFGRKMLQHIAVTDLIWVARCILFLLSINNRANSNSCFAMIEFM